MREGDLMESTEYHTMCIRIYLESLPPLGAWRGVKTGSFIGGFKGPRVYWTPNRGTKRLRVPKKGKLRVPRGMGSCGGPRVHRRSKVSKTLAVWVSKNLMGLMNLMGLKESNGSHESNESKESKEYNGSIYQL